MPVRLKTFGLNPVSGCGVLLLALCARACSAQNAPPPQPASGAPAPDTIYLDGSCHIYEVVVRANVPRTHRYRDDGICSVSIDHYSGHEETTIVAGKRKHTFVTVREHTFQLHNPTASTVTFVVDQYLPDGWQVDSDPHPVELSAKTATFAVIAAPHQTVELHVGERIPPVH